MDTFVNHTPHSIDIDVDGKIFSIPATSPVLRLTETTGRQIETIDGVPIFSPTTYVSVQGTFEPGKNLIVSMLIAKEEWQQLMRDGATGVYAPDTGSTCKRDAKGQIIAVTRLIRYDNGWFY